MNTPTLRPREKIQERTQVALSDHELLQAMIGSGTRRMNVRHIARELLRLLRRGSGNVSYDAVQAIEGIGPARASLIVAAFELARRHQPRVNRNELGGKIYGSGIYCRYYSGGSILIDERWFPDSIVLDSPMLVRQLITAGLQLGVDHCEIYDAGAIDDSLGRLNALQRRHQLMSAGQIVGIRISKYTLVNQNAEKEEIS